MDTVNQKLIFHLTVDKDVTFVADGVRHFTRKREAVEYLLM